MNCMAIPHVSKSINKDVYNRHNEILISTHVLLSEGGIIDVTQIDFYHKYGYVPYIWRQQKLIAFSKLSPVLLHYWTQVYRGYTLLYTNENHIQEHCKRLSHKKNVYRAANILSNINNRTSKTIKYRSNLLKCALTLLFLGQYSTIFCLINSLAFFIQNIFKLFLLMRACFAPSIKYSYTEITYKLYTILIPMYKEMGKMRFVLDAMRSMKYPKSKMEVKIILEEDDIFMLKEASLLTLPNYFHIIITPHMAPKTKPKALNYAMHHAQGEYVAIYDAEDKPDPNQLALAIMHFNSTTPDCICVQARLNFYNTEENIITQLLSLEYAMWFDFFLHGLYASRMPIPLGGTSNHFKMAAIKSIGMWDAYNVTEDAELGLRIYHSGYKTELLNSITLEEAPTSLLSWIIQRSRWIKGFMQTFMLYASYKDSTFRQKLCVYMFIGLSTYIFFMTPLLSIMLFFFETKISRIICMFSLIITIICSYSTIVLLLHRLKKNMAYAFNFKTSIIIMLWPFYFLLHTIAAYVAILELIINPFKWNKTTHSITKFKDLDVLYSLNKVAANKIEEQIMTNNSIYDS